MGPRELAQQIRDGFSPNIPPQWWDQVREFLTPDEEASYHDRARQRWQQSRP